MVSSNCGNAVISFKLSKHIHTQLFSGNRLLMFTPVLLATTVLVICYALDISLKGLFVFFLINFSS